jgi:hypothetical protein
MARDKAGDTTDLTDATPPRQQLERPHKIRKTHGDIHGLLHGDTHASVNPRDNRENIREATGTAATAVDGDRNRIPSSELSSEILISSSSNHIHEDQDQDQDREGDGVPNNSGTSTPPKRTRDMDQKIS